MAGKWFSLANGFKIFPIWDIWKSARSRWVVKRHFRTLETRISHMYVWFYVWLLSEKFLKALPELQSRIISVFFVSFFSNYRENHQTYLQNTRKKVTWQTSQSGKTTCGKIGSVYRDLRHLSMQRATTSSSHAILKFRLRSTPSGDKLFQDFWFIVLSIIQ